MGGLPLARPAQKQVLSLLAHADDDGRLDRPAAVATDDPADEASPSGQRLGAWRLTTLLGRGGMGEVWAAERDDGRFQGRAAVKLLSRGHDSAAVLARFAQEQQALARLQPLLDEHRPALVLLCVKSGALLLYPFTTVLIWAITRRLFDARTAFWTAVVFLTLPGVALSSVIISTDVPLFLCWAAALYAYLKILDTDAWIWWLTAGVACGLGLLTKYTMAIFAVSVLLHLAITPGLRRHFASPKLYVTALVAALVFAPNLIWNAQNGWPTLGHTAQISGLEDGRQGLNWKSFGDFIVGQLGILGPILFLAWLVQLADVKHWIRDERYRLLACFALPFLGAITAQSLIGRANANWAAMAYVGGTIFVVARLLEGGRTQLLIAALTLNIVVAGLAYHFDAIAHAAGIELTRKSDALNKRVRGWRQYGEALAARQAAHPEAILLGDARDIGICHAGLRGITKRRLVDLSTGHQGRDFVDRLVALGQHLLHRLAAPA